MADDDILDLVADTVEPSRRKFILGLIAAGVTAPSVASFVIGRANQSTANPVQPIRPASFIDGSGNFNLQRLDPSGNTFYDPSANYYYDNWLSGNFLRDASGNFLLDPSGNLLCGTSGNILLDGSGNASLDPSGNYQVHPSGNWMYDPYGVVSLPLDFGSGSRVPYLYQSGNAFYDPVWPYGSNGVVDYWASPRQPGLACVISANHIVVAQAPATTTTTTTAAPSTVPANTAPSTSTPAPTSTAIPQVTVAGTIPVVE